MAGFVGMHSALRLLHMGYEVLGIDSLNEYYDPLLKTNRLALLLPFKNFEFKQVNIVDQVELENIFKNKKFDNVLHLAAQAGVRYSIENPHEYVRSNLFGFLNVLDCCKQHDIKHMVYASSSSVYGGNVKQPFSEADSVDHPVSFYAATKKSNELMAYSYSHLFGLPTTGLRFFTVYGPWGRPDMAYYLFAKSIIANESIDVFNHGNMKRDFTYIDDIVEGVVRVLEKPPHRNAEAPVPALVFNIGNHTPVKLLDFIELIEKSLGKIALKNYLPMQNGDVPSTYADVSALNAWVGFKPDTDLAVGVEKFVAWYRNYHQV